MLFEPSELGKEKAWIGMRPIQAFLFFELTCLKLR